MLGAGRWQCTPQEVRADQVRIRDTTATKRSETEDAELAKREERVPDNQPRETARGSAAADEDVRVKLSHHCRGASRQRDHYAHAIRVLSRCTVRWVELVSESAIVRPQSMRKFVF